jgi:hypothetical protein
MTKDYSKNKIYKIYSHLGDKIYIGSTVYEFVSQRMVKHRGSYKQWKKNNGNYTTSFILFEEYGVENCIIELIEAKPCIDINEQARLEGSYIRTLECVNKHIPGRTNKEWRDDNKDKIKEYNEKNKEKIKEYYEKNKEIIKETAKQYYENNKDKCNQTAKQYYENNKDKCNQTAKEYRAKNIDKFKAKDNAYYEKNKEKIKAKNKQFYEKNKDNIKQYYQDNKEIIKAKKKAHYAKNKAIKLKQ